MVILPQNTSAKQRYGAKVESWALAQLQAQGWQARPLGQWTDQADIIIDGSAPLLVEVKGARRREFFNKIRGNWYKRTRYSWDVARIPEGIDLAVILVAQDDAGTYHPFVVPSWAIVARSVTVIHLATHPEAYADRGRGWLAPYYRRWGTIAQVMAARRRFAHAGQLTLWGAVHPA